MEYVITISQLRSALDKHLGDDKRVFIGDMDSTSIKEIDPSTLITVIIDDAGATIRESTSSSPGEAKQEPRGEVAPKGPGDTCAIPVPAYLEDDLARRGCPGSGTANMGWW